MEKTSGWDLHCHTVFSDGTRTPLQLVQEARERGLDGAAITDHDTAAGWTEAANAAHELGMPLIRGTEMSTHWPLGGVKISFFPFSLCASNGNSIIDASKENSSRFFIIIQLFWRLISFFRQQI